MVPLMDGRRIYGFLRFLAAATVVAAFWWFVAPRVQMPSWYFAVLPGAILGWLVAFRQTRWSTPIGLAILLGSLESTFFSQWFAEHARLKAADHVRQSAKQEAQIHAAIAAHLQHQAETQETDSHARSSDSTTPTAVPSGSARTLQLSFHLTLANFPRVWHEWLLAALLGTLAAAQAARMTISTAITPRTTHEATAVRNRSGQ